VNNICKGCKWILAFNTTYTASLKPQDNYYRSFDYKQLSVEKTLIFGYYLFYFSGNTSKIRLYRGRTSEVCKIFVNKLMLTKKLQNTGKQI